MKQKTPMQELIEVLKNRASSSKEIQSTAYPEVKRILEAQIEELEMCIELAESLLGKEKEMIIKVCEIGDWFYSGEEYYNKTFKTKEK